MRLGRIYPEQDFILFFLISIYVSVLSHIDHDTPRDYSALSYIPISISIISLTYIKFMGIFVKHGYSQAYPAISQYSHFYIYYFPYLY